MQENQSNENPIIKDIQAGRYRDCFLIYARKSTDEPDNQKNSIKYQRVENMRFAQREKLPVAAFTLPGFCMDGIVSERHSGFKESGDISITGNGMVQYSIERPKFQRMVQFLSKGLFKGVIVLCWDRLSRNRGDDTVARKLMKTGIEVRFVYTNYDKSSAGALHMDIDGMFAEHYSRVVSEKVRLATRNLRERGICTYKAPVGYLNPGTMERKPFDPERAPIIKRMFETLVNEELSLSDLTGWANQQGLTNRPARRKRTAEEMLAEEDEEPKGEMISRPMTRSRVHQILTDPFYIGKIRGNDGKYVPSNSHEPLITEELFHKAHEVLKRRRVGKKYAQKIDLPGRGLIRCAECRRAYTPYMKKGIQYFNAHCAPDCPNPRKNFSAAFIAGEIAGALAKLSFTDSELAEIDASLKSDSADFEEENRKNDEERERRRKKISEELGYLKKNKLSLLKAGVYSPEALREEETRIEAELAQIQEAAYEIGASPKEFLQQKVKLSELLKNGSEYYRNGNFREKEEFVGIIFSELFFSENTLICRCKNGFKALESRFGLVCGRKNPPSEKLPEMADIRMSLGELEAFISSKRRAPRDSGG